MAQDLKEIETYLKGRKEITHVTTSIGGTPGRYNLVRSVANPSLSYGELIIDFTSPETLVELLILLNGLTYILLEVTLRMEYLIIGEVPDLVSLSS